MPDDTEIFLIRVGITVRAEPTEAVAFSNALYAHAEAFAHERGFEIVRPGEGEVGVYGVRTR